MKPDRVDKIDNVENEVSEERNDDEEFPAIGISQWTSKQGEHQPGDALQDGTGGLKVLKIVLNVVHHKHGLKAC